MPIVKWLTINLLTLIRVRFQDKNPQLVLNCNRKIKPNFVWHSPGIKSYLVAVFFIRTLSHDRNSLRQMIEQSENGFQTSHFQSNKDQ